MFPRLFHFVVHIPVLFVGDLKRVDQFPSKVVKALVMHSQTCFNGSTLALVLLFNLGLFIVDDIYIKDIFSVESTLQLRDLLVLAPRLVNVIVVIKQCAYFFEALLVDHINVRQVNTLSRICRHRLETLGGLHHIIGAQSN